MKRKLPYGIYAITCESRSLGRKNIEVVREMIKGGIEILQYREKNNKTMKEKYFECLEISKIAKENGILFIVNDYIDIAMAVDADGIHIGQDDIPVEVARKLLGHNKIIGVSTHCPEQAIKAVEDGADYIGVGPIFYTNTKENVVSPVGIEYLDFVAKNFSIPFVAIGGIKETNIEEVLRHGAKTVAMVTEITEAINIVEKIQSLRKKLRDFKIIQ
ncbi:MAG: thiamine phosphate synthase [Brevinematia bacterium]